MSYFKNSYQPIPPGTPAYLTSPIPGFNLNPASAGPRWLAFGAAPPPADYQQTSWGVVYGVAAAALLIGAAAGYVAGQHSEKKRYRRNAARRRYRQNGGERFRALERKLAKRGDVKDPAALAAAIGRRKYGKKKFQAMAARGRK